MTVKNPTHASRKGLMYEEAWALLLCARWMASPGTYTNVRFQTAPDEAGDGKFFLDDIVFNRGDGSYDLYQIKHKIHPDTDEWKWKDFTKPNKNNKRSEFAKWFDSLSRMKRGGAECHGFFLTNGVAHNELAQYLVSERIDCESLRAKDKELSDKIQKLIEPGQCDSFFDAFAFRFRQKSRDDVETEARTLLYHGLNATEHGVNSLILEIRKQFAVAQPKPITLGLLRELCEFDVPRPLNQEFDVPKDFQWFDGEVHKRFVEQLADVSGGVQVVVGKPGSGKSTYLSKLSNLLSDGDHVCIRHHYHISPSDPDPVERLSLDRSEEAIKAQFKQYDTLLGDLQYKNSADIPLHDFVSQAAKSSHASGKPLVLIVDGLDHAMRNEAAADLEELLKEVCHPQPGLWVVLGMQEVAKAHLPEIVQSSCPKSDWIVIDGLSDAGVDSIVTANQAELTLPDDDLHLQPILARIRRVTQGNPLHLRYTLNQLRIQEGTQQLSEYGLRNLIPYGNEIGEYYSVLWRNVPDSSKSLLLVAHILDMPLLEQQFFDLAATLIPVPSDVNTTYRQIAHLVRWDRDGLHLFHSSLPQFLSRTEEHGAQRTALLRKVETWLATGNFEELKWALLSVLRHELGQSESLMSIDREWLVDSVAKARQSKSIERQLKLAHDAAFGNSDYAKEVKFASLLNYYQGNTNYHSDIAERLWTSAFRYYQRDPHLIRTSTLSHEQILAVLEAGKSDNQLEDLWDDCLDVLNGAHRYNDFHRRGEWASAPPELAVSTIAAVSMNPDHSSNRVIMYCRGFKDLGWSNDLLGFYADALCRFGQVESAVGVATEKLKGEELKSFCSKLAFRCIWDCNKSVVLTIKQLPVARLTPDCELYLSLAGEAVAKTLSLPQYDRFPEEVDDFDTKGRPVRVGLIRDCFVTALSLTIGGRSKEVEDWVTKAPNRWSIQIVAALLRSAMELAGQLTTDQRVSYSSLIDQLKTVVPLYWPEDRPRIEWQMGLPDTLDAILEVIIALCRWRGQRPVIVQEELLDGLPRQYFGKRYLLRLLNRLKIPLLTEEAFKLFMDSEIEDYRQVRDEFPERARYYLDLFELCIIHSDRDNAGACLYQAANNLLGYGSHKDPFLWYVLESIEACHNAGSRRAIDWLKSVAPVVTNIGQITDRDDVSGFPSELGDLLQAVHPPTLRSWYRFTVANERFGLAEELFPKVIKTLDLCSPGGRAIASTGIDRGSLTVLRELALSNQNAEVALRAIEDQLGKVTFKDEKENTSSSLKKPTQQDVAHIEPANFNRYLSENVKFWERRHFYRPWAKTWLVTTNPRRREAYNALMEQVDPNKMFDAPAELLDEMYPLVLEENKEQAFDYLCWAQTNDRGWAYMFTAKSRAETRWKTVAAHFPNRFHEFFETSIRRTDARDSQESRFFPVPRGIEFHALFDDLYTAEAVTEMLVQTLDGLMANLELPMDSWLYTIEPDNAELLFLRLRWPSSYVRERAATAIAGLILEECSQVGQRFKLLSWIGRRCQTSIPSSVRRSRISKWFCERAAANCSILRRLWYTLGKEQIESQIVLLLLPVVKCLENQDGILKDVFLFLCDQVQISSPVIDNILTEIGNSLDTQPPRPKYKEARTYPEAYNVDRFFYRNIPLFLAPFYMREAEKIESNTSFKFTRMWSYEADQLMEECGIEREAGEAPDFVGGRFTLVVSGFSSQISEAYRSTFLRTLNHCFSAGILDKDTYLSTAFRTMPVELSYWKLKPTRIPDWWPTVITHTADDDKFDSVIGVKFDDEITRVCKGFGNEFILGMTGPANYAEEGASHKHSLRITIVGFAYDTLGSNMPSADSVAKQLLHKPSKVMRPGTARRPFHFMESQEDHVQIPEGRLEIGDLVFEPLVARANDLTINLWQSYRNYLTFILSDSLSNNLRLSFDQNRWSYLENSSRIVASSYDWTNGIGERKALGNIQQFGTYLQCKRQWLEKQLERKNMRLGYLCSVTHSVRKYDYEEPEEFTDNRLINVSQLIV